MRLVSASDDKTHFSQLLLDVEKGEKFIITKHGNKVAKLIPMEAAKPNAHQLILEAIQNIRKMRKGVTLGKKLNLLQPNASR